MAASVKLFLGIDPKVYRHFTIATLAISATVAMFADGEKSEAIATHIDRQAEKTELKKAEAKKMGTTKLVDNRTNNGSRTPTRDIVTYGAPMDGTRNSDSGFIAPTPQTEVAIDPAVLAAMPPKQRAEYLKAIEEQRRKRAAETPTQEQISTLIEASRQRSGSEGD